MTFIKYTNVWAQPCTLVFKISDLLLSYSAVPADVTDIIIEIAPKDSRFSTPAWNMKLSTDPSNVLWDDVTATVRVILNTEDFDNKTYTAREFGCQIGITLDGDDLTVYEPLPTHSSYNTKLAFVDHEIDNLGGSVVDYYQQLTDLDDPFVAPTPSVGFDFPYYDVCYGLTNGADITSALQTAVNTVNVHKKPIWIRAGKWKISSTITCPSRSGLTVIGAGFNHGLETSTYIGSGTILEWNGTAGDEMFILQGLCHTIGDFAIVGNCIGILVKKGAGLGTGTMRFKPIFGLNCDTIVQCGSVGTDNNCDNLHFEWLIANNCSRVYKGVNQQGLDIVFERLNINWTDVGIEMDAGGSLWVQYSITVGPCILLKINHTTVNGSQGVGKNNGYFRLSNTKIDAQQSDDFTLVQSTEPYPIDILADGGLQAQPDTYDGTFISLVGGNNLTLRNWRGGFKTMTGSVDATYGTPTILVEGCRLWQSTANMFSGNLNWRVRNCVPHVSGSSADWMDSDNA